MKAKWSVYLDILTVSENNSREHWRVRHSRTSSQKEQIRAALNKHGPEKFFPCHIHMRRLSPGTMDDDNLPGSMKYIRDAIADYIIPGQLPGRADGDPRLSWSYSQQKTSNKGVCITFYEP